MMRTLAETGNGWMTWKDRSNERCNQTGMPGRTVHLSNLCTEILEVTNNEETAVCNLGSINLGRFVVDGDIDLDRLGRVVRTAVTYLDRVIDINFYPTNRASVSNSKWRPVGLGMMGLQDALFKLRLPFDSHGALELSRRFAEASYFNALWRSTELAEVSGAHEGFSETRAARGALQFDLWGVAPSEEHDWAALRARIVQHGLRNSLLVAVAPTSTIASITDCYETIEPQVSNLFKRETLSGEFLQLNTYLVRDLQTQGLWNEEIAEAVKRGEGSIVGIDQIPAELKDLYRTSWELPQKAIIDMAVARGAFIDQSQSLNLFVESPTIGKLSSMYMYAWKVGLKTTYYLRSRPATRITKTTAFEGAPNEPIAIVPDAEAIACSLENPEHCEACE
jgi:ribonucleoside-diphosphate reductase alpha chain